MLKNYSVTLFTCFFITSWGAHGHVIPEEIGPYFQGDIILKRHQLSGQLDIKYRWTNATVHYEFEDGYPPNLQEIFLLATEHISSQTCLKFKPRNNILDSAQNDYIYVIGAEGRPSACYSYVGRQGGKQVISLPAACNKLGTFIHELLHAIGFHHEQSRTDRDDYVNIIWDNVLPRREHQFKKYGQATVTSFGVPYDYNSILHYSKTAFSIDSKKFNTIEPLLPGKGIGQRKRMSEGDVTKVNRMYDCI